MLLDVNGGKVLVGCESLGVLISDGNVCVSPEMAITCLAWFFDWISVAAFSSWKDGGSIPALADLKQPSDVLSLYHVKQLDAY